MRVRFFYNYINKDNGYMGGNVIRKLKI